MKRTLFLLPIFCAAGAHAVMIDDFTDGARTLTVAPGTFSVAYDAPIACIMGSRRSALSSYPGASPTPATLSFGNGLVCALGGRPAEVFLYYGVTSTGGLLQNDVNLSSDSFVNFHFASTSAPVNIDFRLRTWVGGFAFSRRYATTAPASASPSVVTFDLHAPTNDLGGSLSDVDYVEITLGSSSDFELSKIETVPEPASMLALGAGAIALLRRKRRA